MDGSSTYRRRNWPCWNRCCGGREGEKGNEMTPKFPSCQRKGAVFTDALSIESQRMGFTSLVETFLQVAILWGCSVSLHLPSPPAPSMFLGSQDDLWQWQREGCPRNQPSQHPHFTERPRSVMEGPKMKAPQGWAYKTFQPEACRHLTASAAVCPLTRRPECHQVLPPSPLFQNPLHSPYAS